MFVTRLDWAEHQYEEAALATARALMDPSIEVFCEPCPTDTPRC